MLKRGYYATRGGLNVRLDRDIVSSGFGFIAGVGCVPYDANGEFAYKACDYPRHPGVSFDLIVETWRAFDESQLKYATFVRLLREAETDEQRDRLLQAFARVAIKQYVAPRWGPVWLRNGNLLGLNHDVDEDVVMAEIRRL